MWTSRKRFQIFATIIFSFNSFGFAQQEALLWKDALKQGFTASMSRLKQIIMDGETPSEKHDFMRRFNDHESWFDSTLAATNSQHEQSYDQLIQKQMALDTIIAVQDQAENILKERLKTVREALPDYRTLRLYVLYAVNSFVHKNSGDGVTATMMLPEEIELVVDSVIQEAARSMSGQVATIQQQSEEGPVLAEHAGTFEFIQTNVKQSLEYSRQLPAAVQQVVNECKQSFVSKLESATKENLELQVIIMDTNQQLERAHYELQQWQGKTHTEQKARLDAQAYAQLTDELADRRCAELATSFDIKKTLLDEFAHSIFVQAKEVQEREAWVDQVSAGILLNERRDIVRSQQELIMRQRLERELEALIVIEIARRR